jgi:uncharacterized protein (TIGR02145 family)
MSYQAVIWDASGNLVSEKMVSIKLSILQGSVTGTSVYSESHRVQTNVNGLVSLMIGGGTNATGKISDINWGSGSYFLKTETDPAGGSNYIITGTTQFVSVPYALIAGNIQTPNAGLPGQVLKLDEQGKPFWSGSSYPIVSNQMVSLTSCTSGITVNVASDGGSSVTSRGVVWSTTTMPTISSTNKVQIGAGTGSFSTTISNLIPNTTYYIRAFATNEVGTGYGSEIKVTTSAIPTLTTNPIVDITSTTAKSGGTINADCGANATSKGVVWSNSPNPTVSASTKTNDGTGTGSFSSSLTGLSPNTTYYVRAYATNSVGTGYGNEINFTTSTSFVLPTVSTISASSISTTTATSGGNISSDGGSAVTTRGVVWSTSPTPTISLSTKTSDGSGTGSFSSSLTGLSPNTTYYVRAYATNSVGTGYGNQVIFITNSTTFPPTVTTSSISAITSTTATSGGNISSDGGSAVTTRGVIWSTSTNPTISLTTKTSNGTGTGTFSSSLSGLSQNTTYYVRAYATNSIGTGYGEVLKFINNSLPTVLTISIDTFGSIFSKYTGKVVFDGGSPIIERGVVINNCGKPILPFNQNDLNQHNKDSLFTDSHEHKSRNDIDTNEISRKNLEIIGNEKKRFEKIKVQFSDSGIEQEINVEIENGLVFWSDDILLFSEKEFDLIKLEKGNIHSIKSLRWPSGIIPYTISNNHSLTNDILEAIKITNNQTNINLIPRTNETNYVEFVEEDKNRCFAIIGMAGGRQRVNVNNCGIATIIHEIGHALGMWHEHQRNDRDDFITIQYENIEDDKKFNFDKKLDNILPIGNYDYFSIMHYYSAAGSKNGNPTIIPKRPPATFDMIPYPKKLSEGDIFAINSIYRNKNNCVSIYYPNDKGLGDFSGFLNGLKPNQKYYIRTYANNNTGTGYGNEITFTTGTGSIPPTVTTTSISAITSTTSISGGNISSDGGAAVTSRGVVWSTSANPTISLTTKTNNGSGIGTFNSSLTGLTPNTTYYVRAYATNSVGTGYGNEITFTTTNSNNVTGIPCPGIPTVKDIDGNTYNTVQIGAQCWTKENLKVTKYRDSSVIPLDESGGTAGNGTGQTWSSRTTGARTVYGHSAANLATFGYLYNWYAVADPKGLCPSGWHVPSDLEWTTMTNYLGGGSVAGGKMKAIDTTKWLIPNLGATNESGFTAIPSGFRWVFGGFYDLNGGTIFWSATEDSKTAGWYYYLREYTTSLDNFVTGKDTGGSIRCLKN